MAGMGDMIVRQVAAASSQAPSDTACGTSNDYDGRMGLRISAIFVILVGALSGMKPTAKTSAPLTIQVLRSPSMHIDIKASGFRRGRFS